MRAIVLEKFGGLDSLVYRDLPAVNLAVNAGARVIATMRRQERFAMLEKLGAARVKPTPNRKASRLPWDGGAGIAL